jgi:hypothetical protein
MCHLSAFIRATAVAQYPYKDIYRDISLIMTEYLVDTLSIKKRTARRLPCPLCLWQWSSRRAGHPIWGDPLPPRVLPAVKFFTPRRKWLRLKRHSVASEKQIRAGKMMFLVQLLAFLKKCDWRPNVIYPANRSEQDGMGLQIRNTYSARALLRKKTLKSTIPRWAEKNISPGGPKILPSLTYKNLQKFSELCSN